MKPLFALSWLVMILPWWINRIPRVDGIHAGFYQHMWETVGETVCNYAIQFFDTDILPKGLNDTLQALIALPYFNIKNYMNSSIDS